MIGSEKIDLFQSLFGLAVAGCIKKGLLFCFNMVQMCLGFGEFVDSLKINLCLEGLFVKSNAERRRILVVVVYKHVIYICVYVWVYIYVYVIQ